MGNIHFSEIMIGYSLENTENPTELKISFPDIFIGSDPFLQKNLVSNSINKSIYNNAYNPPALKHSVSYNYLTIPVSAGMNLGSIAVKDKLIVAFPNGNPKLSRIIGRM